jgi:hypothetical protein
VKKLDKKQWIIASVLVIIIAAVAFNFNTWTGKAVSSQTKISVTPVSLNAGEQITINVIPAKGVCFEPEVEIFRVQDSGELGLRNAGPIEAKTGTMNNCEEFEVTYKTKSDWEGSYAAVVKDSKTQEIVRSPVFVLNSPY